MTQRYTRWTGWLAAGLACSAWSTQAATVQVDVVDDAPGQVLVGLHLGDGARPVRLLSRISQLSARRLGIRSGRILSGIMRM